MSAQLASLRPSVAVGLLHCLLQLERWHSVTVRGHTSLNIAMTNCPHRLDSENGAKLTEHCISGAWVLQPMIISLLSAMGILWIFIPEPDKKAA